MKITPRPLEPAPAPAPPPPPPPPAPDEELAPVPTVEAEAMTSGRNVHGAAPIQTPPDEAHAVGCMVCGASKVMLTIHPGHQLLLADLANGQPVGEPADLVPFLPNAALRPVTFCSAQCWMEHFETDVWRDVAAAIYLQLCGLGVAEARQVAEDTEKDRAVMAERDPSMTRVVDRLGKAEQLSGATFLTREQTGGVDSRAPAHVFGTQRCGTCGLRADRHDGRDHAFQE